MTDQPKYTCSCDEHSYVDLEDAYAGDCEHIRRLEAENKALEESRDAARRMARVCHARAQDLEDEYMEARRTISRLARENAELRTERGNLQEAADREIHGLQVECMELQRQVAELTQQRDRMASAVRFAIRHYIETPDAEAAVMACLNGYTDGKPDITHLLAA